MQRNVGMGVFQTNHSSNWQIRKILLETQGAAQGEVGGWGGRKGYTGGWID